ncbi:hypothetical protein Q9314_28480 (plasmid) [Shinella sumterensis]|nr:hypothetical protein Q9314_28480 [Shinella sumterensis]
MKNIQDHVMPVLQSFGAGEVQDAGSLPSSIPEDQLRPGMPVETFISTGDRTFLDYLVKPLVDSARHAFIEE